ncbi:hypothetical protein KP79_PYT00972 [Mizuhopecten yessoensis]|uniref:Uncharacterized protein n=2 Tax=Mizuhopecten yessoensis TaxID=6573 RepID=A0A210QM88_MIZYE|nr:hypothetical protein KP79_PYT00972 [Mizuhopecten yessoensis]
MMPLASTPELRQLVEYLDRVWFRSSVWTPANWCVYRQSVRTNNDVEGWHRRMNGKAGRANLPFYLLVPLMKKEGEIVNLQMRLVGENLLARHQTTTYKRVQGKIFALWDRLDSGDPDNRLTTSDFLRKVGNIYAPRE